MKNGPNSLAMQETTAENRKMEPTGLMAEAISGNLGLLQAALADFSDQEMLVRPVPTANHALWQLGHLAVSEWWFVEKAGYGGVIPAPPEGWAEKFTPANTKVDNPDFFPTKAEVLAYYARVREAMPEWVRGLTGSDLDKPMPEAIAKFAPTLGHLVLMIPVHLAMHVGQFQVIRRALGKPVLF